MPKEHKDQSAICCKCQREYLTCNMLLIKGLFEYMCIKCYNLKYLMKGEKHERKR